MAVAMEDDFASDVAGIFATLSHVSNIKKRIGRSTSRSLSRHSILRARTISAMYQSLLISIGRGWTDFLVLSKHS
jgi:hypothetical protein